MPAIVPDLVGPKALGLYDEAWLRELVRLFRLEPLLQRPPYRLSDGEKKRVAFAAALAHRPAILALDEPTSGQDLHFRSILGTLLAEAMEARGFGRPGRTFLKDYRMRTRDWLAISFGLSVLIACFMGMHRWG